MGSVIPNPYHVLVRPDEDQVRSISLAPAFTSVLHNRKGYAFRLSHLYEFLNIIIIGVIGASMEMIMRFLEARLIPWRGKG